MVFYLNEKMRHTVLVFGTPESGTNAMNKHFIQKFCASIYAGHRNYLQINVSFYAAHQRYLHNHSFIIIIHIIIIMSKSVMKCAWLQIEIVDLLN